jgi:hypothetical protein
MYWKDELDALYQKNRYGKGLWHQLKGQQVEMLLKNNLRKVGTVMDIEEQESSLFVHFKVSGNGVDNKLWVLNKRDIRYVDPYLK